MQKVITWWERGLVAALYLSIALLGIGRLEFFLAGGSISAWSVSRTTFFFWVILKLLLFVRGGWAATGLSKLRSLTPLYWFFFVVTLSLLPDFRQAGDYRYFCFGCFHAVMIVDLFSAKPQSRWLPMLMGSLPGVLVARGLAHDPQILSFSLAHRFSFPLDHANTAGYLLSMSIPLALAAGITKPGWRGRADLVSCASQVMALILTFSRGAWVGWGASILYLAVTTRKWKWVAALLIVAVTAVLAFPSVQQRLTTFVRPEADQSMRDRLQLITSSVEVGLENPVLGVGYGRGRLKEALRSRLRGTVLDSSPIWHTHNVYIELFAETGLLGMLTFLWLLGGVLFRISRAALKREGADRLLGYGLLASWIAAMVTGLGDVPFYHHETRIFFFSLLAFAHIYYSGASVSESYRAN